MVTDVGTGAARGATGAADRAHPLQRHEFVHSLLDEAVARTPDAFAVRDAFGRWTYRELDEYSHACAAWLRSQGVGHGDRVVFQLPSRRELAALFLGASRCGAIFVPLNTAMKEFHLASVLGNAEPVLVVGQDAMLNGLRAQARVPVRDLAEAWPEIEALTELGPVRADPRAQPDDVSVLVYTSGSTASPKAVICPHAQIAFATRALVSVLGYRPDDVVFCRFPISWDYGLYKVLMSIVGGSEIVLAGDESDLVLLKRMRETGTTVVPIVPSLAAMIASLAQRDRLPPPPVRLITNTGAKLADSTIEELRAAFPGASVVRQFGQTECKRISVMPPERDRERPDAVGLPLPGTRVLILDEEGRELPPGGVGEIVAAGPHVMPGYWRNPEATAKSFRRDPETGAARLHTGDYGSLDEDGYLYFEGRRDDMFKRKGIRMSTIEIEAAAMDIPAVRAAAAVPPEGDRDLAIFVESDLESHQVLRELSRRLEAQKVPAICKVVAELPLTLHGKNARKALTEMLELDGSPR